MAGLGAGALGITTALALATPASAHHNIPSVDVQEGECGAVTIGTEWTQDTHTVANTVLVVQAHGEQHTAPIGEQLEIGATEQETATIRWRIWGGGERNYDNPALDSLPDLLDHLDGGGDVLDPDAPGVAWHKLYVDGCPPEEDPTPTPTPEPSTPAVPEEEEPGGEGGGDELPVTGASTGIMAGAAAGLVGLGGALYLVARRRRVSFTA